VALQTSHRHGAGQELPPDFHHLYHWYGCNAPVQLRSNTDSPRSQVPRRTPSRRLTCSAEVSSPFITRRCNCNVNTIPSWSECCPHELFSRLIRGWFCGCYLRGTQVANVASITNRLSTTPRRLNAARLAVLWPLPSTPLVHKLQFFFVWRLTIAVV
jgi:hypothetical protein